MGNSTPAKAAPHNGDVPEEYRIPFTKRGRGGYTTEDRTAVHDILVAADGPASTNPDAGGVPEETLMQLMARAVANHGEEIALRVETGLGPVDMKNKTCPDPVKLTDWKSWTWAQYDADCQAVAKGLIANGVERYDGVNIYGFNSPEWVMGELGAMYCGAIASGIYPSDKPAQVAFKSHHSKSSAAIVESLKHVRVYEGIVNETPDLKVIVVWDEKFEDLDGAADLLENGIKRKDGSHVNVITWDNLIQQGKDDEGLQARLEERTKTIQPGSTCAYIYTSGTTGQPKAVMMSHDNIIFEARSADNSLEIFGFSGEERIISYLPLSHVAGMLLDIVYPIACTAYKPHGWFSTNFARPYDLKILKIVDRIKCIRPTLFLGVPRVWEKFAEKMQEIGAAIRAKGGLKPMISSWAKGKLLYNARESTLGGSGSRAWGHSVASYIMGKAKAGLGLDQMKFALTGAAPIKIETLEYFGQLGICINEVYGMSECAGASTFSTDHVRFHLSFFTNFEFLLVRSFVPNEFYNEKLFHNTCSRMGILWFSNARC